MNDRSVCRDPLYSASWRARAKALFALLIGMLVAAPVGAWAVGPESTDAASTDAVSADAPAPEAPRVEREARPVANDGAGEAPEGAASPDGDEAIRDASACPALFGDADQRRDNRDQRRADLLAIEERGSVVEITHSRQWRRPHYLEFRAFDVDAIETVDGEAQAVVSIASESIRDVECASGRYRVGADDALGEDGRVVGVFDDGLLVEYDGDLGYLLADGAAPPTWQMVWRSGWTLPRPRGEVSTFGGRSNARSRNRNRNRKRSRSRSRRR